MQIRPTQTSFAPDGQPVSFTIKTGEYPYYAVQVATDAFLFNGTAAARRTRANFFDSWHGDELERPGSRPVQREVAGVHLEAPTGSTTYTLPKVVWQRLRSAPKLYYRLIVAKTERRKSTARSVEDVDWNKAPSVSIARLPAQPARNPASGFRGRNVIDRADFTEQAASQLKEKCLIQGRDGDWRYAVLKASCFHMTVLECHEWGLTDTVAKMPRKPDAIINGQFISSTFGVGTEGQVIREGQLINDDSQSKRYYIAQTWRGSDVSDVHVGLGDPDSQETDARVGFGGLGPVLLSGAPVTSLTEWAKSIYDRSATTGRGVIAIHRNRGIILLMVQQNSSFYSTNSMILGDLRDLLKRLGFDDVVFNDGSDSESLYVNGSWLLTPGSAKDEAMDFAISFVNRQRNRRVKLLAIDGTQSADGEAFISGTARPPLTHYSPHNLSQDLEELPAMSPIAATFHSDLIQAWRATTQAQADLISHIIELAGAGGQWADILYVSSHSWRHGQLWYYEQDNHSKPKLVIADLWSSDFKPKWNSTPRWLIIAGCAVLGLRYSRGLALDVHERGHLLDWHQEIYGSGTAVPDYSPSKQTLLATYHPGWAWYKRVFSKSASLRGILGYWYRSPSGGRDAEIIKEFTKKLREGETFLNAWESANRGGWFEAQALWAAMVRDGCEKDTLATLEDASLTAVKGEYKYYDRYQRGKDIASAYRYANRLNEADTIGGVSLRYNDEYDKLAIDELGELSVTPANFLAYNDGVGP
jgi:Phosphodiester glycosidase